MSMYLMSMWEAQLLQELSFILRLITLHLWLMLAHAFFNRIESLLP